MHGIIFNELKKYANATFGDRTWDALLAQAGLQGSIYLASRSYPDEQVGAIVAAASSATRMPPAEILEGFGEFIAPDLLAMFRSLIRPEWRTLDMLENTEETIHKVVRLQVVDAAPPYLSAKRIAPDSVLITYTSPRRLCAVARGIARGVAEHYGEPIALTEPSCMLRGDGDCQIVVRVISH
jgi:hypothetical protein